jgi:hypothetical protein
MGFEYVLSMKWRVEGSLDLHVCGNERDPVFESHRSRGASILTSCVDEARKAAITRFRAAQGVRSQPARRLPEIKAMQRQFVRASHSWRGSPYGPTGCAVSSHTLFVHSDTISVPLS